MKVELLLCDLKDIARSIHEGAFNDLYKFELANEYENDPGMKYHEIMKYSRYIFNRLHKISDKFKEYKSIIHFESGLYDIILVKCRIGLNILKIYQNKLKDKYSLKAFNEELDNLIVFYAELFKKYLED